ncbi:hypothetical protein J4N45_09850 [Vibrio sp. SCSIO 43140]|uniref:hypothetical protein n=1 Tax=Vibrio sp. SCSIO 43140 TaxID=2819100 RepID=UPI002075E6F0|nr:hypothetical protein [Vibrio sp. SCSIO 43140]USD58831.1 hypothetical protein J4N45_09850 [Vibrio sp. SCSIO 43140]
MSIKQDIHKELDSTSDTIVQASKSGARRSYRIVMMAVGVFPSTTFFCLLALAFLAHESFGGHLFPYLSVAIIVAMVHGLIIKNNKDYQKLMFDFGGGMPPYLYVKGAPDNLDKKVMSLIGSNQLVCIRCPKHVALENALFNMVTKHGGVCEFIRSDRIEIFGKPLGKRTVLLSYRSKKTLENSISIMQQRGWDLYGEQGVETSLLDRVYTQTMVYEPTE